MLAGNVGMDGTPVGDQYSGGAGALVRESHKREELERRQRDIKERLELAHWELSEIENCMIEIDKQIKQIEDEKNAQYGIYKMKLIETNEQHGVTK